MSKLQNAIKEVDAVFVHKDRCLVDTFSYLASIYDKKMDNYLNPQEFLINVGRYSKHTKIIMGRTFNNNAQYGIQIAEQLHALGFTHLYLMVMLHHLPEIPIPDYLTVIENFESDTLEEIFSS